MVEQSVLANSSKFIDGSFEEEQSYPMNSLVVQDQQEENTVENFTNNASTNTKEPLVVEQSVLADSSSFIQITEEKPEHENNGSLFSEVEVEEEKELQEDIILD